VRFRNLQILLLGKLRKWIEFDEEIYVLDRTHSGIVGDLF
jgi:hypothetical protein